MASTIFKSITGGNANYPSSGGVAFRGGNRTFAFQGTFDSGDIKLQAAFDGGSTFIDLKDGAGNDITVSSNTILTIDLGPCLLRFNLSGSGGSTDVDVYIA
jgi:hypothetical protein